MTLIAIRTGPDHAEILSDTLAYGLGDTNFVHCHKVRALPHADMAIAGKGPGEFTAQWTALIDIHPDLGNDLDALDAEARKTLPEIWDEIDNRDGRRSRGWVYMVGWSPAQSRFIAWEYDSDAAFEAREVGRDEVFLNPQPSEDLPEPSDTAAWVRLGERIYQDCSLTLDQSQKTMIGGGLILTRIERGAVTQRRIHDLPEDDWRYRQMLIGTTHPVGQMGPCICGSGQPYMVCHLPAFDPDWPCPCVVSGKPFVECHRLDLADPAVFAHWRAHPEDFHRTQQGLRAAWDRNFPDAPRHEPPQFIKPPEHTAPLAASAPAPVLQNRAERRAAARRAGRRNP